MNIHKSIDNWRHIHKNIDIHLWIYIFTDIHCGMSLHGYPCLEINVDIHAWMDNWRLTSKNHGYPCWYPWIFGNPCMDLLWIFGPWYLRLQCWVQPTSLNLLKGMIPQEGGPFIYRQDFFVTAHVIISGSWYFCGMVFFTASRGKSSKPCQLFHGQGRNALVPGRFGHPLTLVSGKPSFLVAY